MKPRGKKRTRLDPMLMYRTVGLGGNGPAKEISHGVRAVMGRECVCYQSLSLLFLICKVAITEQTYLATVIPTS